MAKSTGPLLKKCKSLGIDPAFLGYSKKSKKNPKMNNKRKVSEYGLQLKEKQKTKFIYGVLEKQFRRYFEMASNKKGVTGENLLQILESRLDNVVYRLGYANTRAQARQFVNHGQFEVNGKKVNIPSYLVKVGDVITIKENKKDNATIKANMEGNSGRPIPKWLEMDAKNASGKVVRLASREDIDLPIEEHLIVELYSK
ncbi:MAG: 30S ribosomal protein S4 [Clostridia bacterium]|nr:30S ribosomal protein S4 [Clostridia bacterium]